jgi:hypothetical protein
MISWMVADAHSTTTLGQWGILSLLIDTQAKQTHSTQAGTAARQGERTRERGSRRVPTNFELMLQMKVRVLGMYDFGG